MPNTIAPSEQGPADTGLLGPVQVRDLLTALGIRPTKTLGQNFVHDAGTVRRIARYAGVQPGETVLEIGPGLGSLTLALLETGASVVAVEIDPVLARALPVTVADRMGQAAGRLHVVCADALTITGPRALHLAEDAPQPTRLVANLPYNVAVPVLLTLLAALPGLVSATVMVQAEVADRLAAPPGSRTYGIPSAKTAWYAAAPPLAAPSSGRRPMSTPPWSNSSAAPLRPPPPPASRFSPSSTPLSPSAARPCARRSPLWRGVPSGPRPPSAPPALTPGCAGRGLTSVPSPHSPRS